MKVLFSFLFPSAVLGGSLLRRYLDNVEFPTLDILILSYVLLAVVAMLITFDEDELDVLRIILFVLGMLTLIVSLLIKTGQTVMPHWLGTVKNVTVIFMGGFLGCYVKLFILDMLAHNNRHF